MMPVNKHSIAGLSPHLRGTADFIRGWLLQCRFIPALTGNRIKIDATKLDQAVYPRTYGEQYHACDCWRIWYGLSPHLRGTGEHRVVISVCHRFIPALTGNRSIKREPTALPPVYPRTYGEQFTISVDGAASAGLSPHLRGTVCCFASVLR